MLKARPALRLCIPIGVPVRHRPELVDPLKVANVIPTANIAHLSNVAPAASAPAVPTITSTPPLGVRIGRLPPRSDSSPLASPRPVAPPPARNAAGSPAGSAGILPRPPVTAETWAELDRAAARLGIESLKTEQRRVMRAVIEGRDTVATFPAGFGKSVCYLAPALTFSQPVLVVSGRARLLRSQYDRLLQRRIPVAWLDRCSGRERTQALSLLAAGGPLIVFSSPETLDQTDVAAALTRSGLALAVVDEAHSASEWSDELRPACARLSETFARLGSPPVLALCGASTAATRHDLTTALGLRSPLVVEGPAIRENIALDVIECRGEVRQRLLIELVMRLRRPGIVFCATPREVDAVHAALTALRVPAHRYHPLLAAGERLGEQLNFLLPGRRSIMVATSGFAPNAAAAGLGEAEQLERAPEGFGLGLDKRDLRFVIHYGAPTSLEQYAREIGLAGRDGESASAVLLHAPEDRSRAESLLAELRIVPAHVFGLARALEGYALDRRAATLEALGLSSGLSRRATEVVAAALEDAGVITCSAGWARVSVDMPTLFDRVRRLSAWLETLRRQDAHRLSAVAQYGRSPGCRSQFLARYFGAAVSSGACACAVCKPGQHPVASASEPPPTAPERRPAAREFSITRFDERPSRDHSQPLTVKLGDFGILAKSR